jgi:hypothetical protein
MNRPSLRQDQINTPELAPRRPVAAPTERKWAREVSKSAQLVTLLYATAAFALMVRSPWLAAAYDLPQRSC